MPLDIRPTQGEMPFDAAAQAFAVVNAKQPWDTRARRPVIVGYTPWTICFRPLYFEEIGLERYGCSAGVFQPFISYSHFLTTVPLMPYRMVVRCRALASVRTAPANAAIRCCQAIRPAASSPWPPCSRPVSSPAS